ncbi:MAG: DUF1592 domain-containing protein [Planctomycetes bacterium]|nr:DUF1592 domain-containing protein [Planctomycetota bacterium]
MPARLRRFRRFDRTAPLGLRVLGAALVASGLLATAAGRAHGVEDTSGKRIYHDRCASCHGEQGQGVRDKYAEPLVGDRSLASLARYIEKRMPDEKPGTCVGEDAKQVAQFIFNAFYSSEAQLRTNAPRVELARLTASQYRICVADLIASFHGDSEPSEVRGLHAEYFNDGRGFSTEKRVLERTEPTLQVSFTAQKPSDKIDKDEYAIRWSGSLAAAETGDYDIILDTANGARVWVNDRKRPLIDAWVRSGEDSRHVATIALLAGRTYHLRVEIAKEKKESVVSAVLKWKPPHGAEEIVPTRLLSPGGGAQWLVLKTPFPPDDTSLGYERGNSVSKSWDEATTQAAFEVAGYVHDHLEQVAGVRADAGDARPRLVAFLHRFAERAFRRPLDDEQNRYFVDRHFAGDASTETALLKSLILVLKSPRFLFPGADADGRDPYAVASRLSFALWDSLPDPKLLEAAKGGRLANRAGMAAEVERMLKDPRAHTKLRQFYHRWLKLDNLRGLAKEAGRFAGFDDVLVADLRTSLDLFLDEVTWDATSDYRRLMVSETIPLNGRLAKFYGVELPEDAPFQMVALGKQPRAGLLTHPLMMAGFSYSATSSPIHRGVFISRSMLGRRLRSPPDSITPESPALHPDMTTRERIGRQTKPAMCMTCHDMINPLGFTMENFDAVGRFRQDELGKPLDTSGSYRRMDGELVEFHDARDLGAFLATSEEAQGAFVERLFKDVVKQPILAYGPTEKERLRRYFVDHACSIRALLVELAVSSAMIPPTASKATSP